MATKPKLDADLSGEPVDQTDYRSKIGPLKYLPSSRPVIVQADVIDTISSKSESEKHLKRLKGYFDTSEVPLTWELLVLRRFLALHLTAFYHDVDASQYVDTRKSTSRRIQFPSDQLVTGLSKESKLTQLQDMASTTPKYLFVLRLSVISQSNPSCNPLQHSRNKAPSILGRMPTKIELTLEQSQQGVSNDVLVSIEGVEELKRNVWIKGLKKVALHTTKDKTGYNTYVFKSLCLIADIEDDIMEPQ
ncbi:hypothetical protein Tco_1201720 [Tanacetum coccineum]